jgi:N utilization substance protein A
MDKSKFIAALTQIASEKNLNEDVILDAVKQAIGAAYRKDYGSKDQEIEVVLRDDAQFASILLIKEVVDEVENENFEISYREAKKIKKDVEIGDEIRIDVTPVEYGRIAAQSAKQVILQKLQEAEREALFHRFQDRQDTLLTATVNRVEGNYVFLEIEKTTVLLQPRDQIKSEKYFPGRRMRVYLEKVQQTSRGPQLRVSRTHPRLIELLLAQEIPEIEHEEVEVKATARDAGIRSKVAVSSDDSKIDPVGACIGQRGTRIAPVMDELSGERVDVIEWSDDPTMLIARSLQPAKISNVVIVIPEESIDPDTGRRVKKRAAVFVEEVERAMAVGKRGQNIRLASDLTGFELDMYNVEEYEPFLKKLQEVQGEQTIKSENLNDEELEEEE